VSDCDEVVWVTDYMLSATLPFLIVVVQERHAVGL
jgi:hypothetical protein